MADTVKIGWGGGKDSTCAVYLHIEQRDIVKAVCYIPMFTKEIPLLNKEHYSFILLQKERFERLGASVFFAEGITYYDYVFSIAKKNKYKGMEKGYPYIGHCGFRRDSKIAACQSVDVGYYDYESIGIAADEYHRLGQLSEKIRSILVEKGVAGSDARMYCFNKNALSPHYKYSKRDGCALCFNAKKIERDIWFNDYPEAVPIVKEMQESLKPILKGRKNEYPLRNYEYFIDDQDGQLSLF